MKRRPPKVEEPAGTYAAKKPTVKSSTAPAPKAVTPQIRYAPLEDVQKVNDRLMKIHGDVLRRLAQ